MSSPQFMSFIFLYMLCFDNMIHFITAHITLFIKSQSNLKVSVYTRAPLMMLSYRDCLCFVSLSILLGKAGEKKFTVTPDYLIIVCLRLLSSPHATVTSLERQSLVQKYKKFISN